MVIPTLKYFYSTNDIKLNGDNAGTILNPAGLVYSGNDFHIYAGETIMIVPMQGDRSGPWKIYRSALYNNCFVRNKTAKRLCYIVTNKWIFKHILVARGCLLDWLLSHPGISHTMGYIAPHDMEHINHVYQENEDTDEDTDEDEDDQVDGDGDKVPIQQAPRLTTGMCHQCHRHNVEVIHP